jgi:diguanylate cyclase (GGDEF)-like protein/PAS domain S-box-containing protein
MQIEEIKMDDSQKILSQQLYRYKYIIENIKDVIWELNKDFVFTFVSPNSREMAGYEADEMMEHKLIDFLPEESKIYLSEQTVLRLNQRLNGDVKNTVLHEVQFNCKNGDVKWVEVTANLLFEEGEFIGYIGTTRDITEKKEYELQLNKYIQELKMLNAELGKTATTDILTGAFNRRKFEDDINSIIYNIGRQDVLLSLILFDIDHFKTVNDNFGHKIGDFALQHIAKLISENIRTTDQLYRWGGDEFIIILPGSNWESTKIVAEKLRNIIQSEDFGMGKKITISAGFGEHISGENADQMVARLDKALYQAKVEGRNRIVSARLAPVSKNRI